MLLSASYRSARRVHRGAFESVWVRWSWTALAWGMAAAAAAAPPADAPQRMLAKLRSKGHYDLAAEFLDRAESDPLVPLSFRERARYERVGLLVDAAHRATNPARRGELLSEAERSLDALLAAGNERGEAASALADAQGRLAVATADEARRAAVAARRTPPGAPREAALASARDALTAAAQRLDAAAERYAAERASLRGANTESPQGKRRRELGGLVAQAQLLSARLGMERALTQPEAGADRKTDLERAATALGGLYEKNSKWVVGLYAHLYEGKCRRLLGQAQLAAAALEDLATQPATTPEVRRLVTLAQAERAALAIDLGKPGEALAAPSEWLEKLSSDDARGVEAATLRYWLGEAALREAAPLAERDSRRRRLLVQAREWLQESAREPSEVQAEARDAWARAATALGVEPGKAKDFATAVASAKDAVAALAATRLRIDEAREQKSPTDALEAQATTERDTARGALEAGLRLAAKERPEPPQDAVNEARYLLSWLDWDEGLWADAAQKGEYIATKAPDDPVAPMCVRLALAALQRMANEAPPEQSAALAARTDRLARFALDRWPEGETAETARSVLLSGAIAAGRMDEAQGLLANASGPEQAELALRIAVAVWERGLSDAKQFDREAALERLGAAVNNAEGPVTPLRRTAVLYLASASMDGGDPARAAELALRAQDGPWNAVVSGAPPADTPRFAAEALRVVIRALAAIGGDQKTLEAARKRLGESLAAGPADEATRGWLALGVRLQRDLQQARERGDEGPAARLAAELGSVLGAIRYSQAPADWNTMLWSAQAAAAAAGGAPPGSEQRTAALRLAGESWRALVERASASPGFAPNPSALLAARLEAGETLRAAGEYAAALDAFAALLAERGSLLEAQASAARTLADWGQQKGDRDLLEQSIAGARPGSDKKNVVWGWAKLAAVAGQAARSDPRRNELFFEAWRNVARSRRLVADITTAAERDEQLRKAITTIRALKQQYPDLGGDASRAAFDSLMRDIQRASGDREVGLAAFEKPRGRPSGG